MHILSTDLHQGHQEGTMGREQCHQKNQLKWIKDLNTKLETVKLLEEIEEEKHQNISLENNLLPMSPKL